MVIDVLWLMTADKLVKVTSMYEHSKSMQRVDSAKHEVDMHKTNSLAAHKTEKLTREQHVAME